MTLSQKKIVVTGCAQGAGAAAEGAEVFAVNRANADGPGKAYFIACDSFPSMAG